MKKLIKSLLNKIALKNSTKIITVHPPSDDNGLSPIMGFSKELYIFLKNADISKTSHQLIIQAYLDIIRLCYKKNITHSHKREIEEFRKTINQAISRSNQKIKSI